MIAAPVEDVSIVTTLQNENPSNAPSASQAVRELYARLFELESDAILLVDNQSGRVLEVNAAACTLYGYSREEWIGMDHASVSTEPEKTREVSTQHLTRVPLRWHRRKDGAVFAVEATCTHFVWQGRDVHLAAIRDITSRLQADRALAESEARYRVWLEAIPMLAWRCDAQGQCMDCNQRWYSFTGQTPADVRGNGWMQAVHPEDRSRVARRVHDDVMGGEFYECEYRLRRAADGVYRWHLARAYPLKDETGRILAWFGAAPDIEDQKRIERDLQRSEAKYRRLYQSIMDGFVSVTMDGHIVEFNNAYLEMLGYDADEVRHLTYVQLTPDHWHAFEADIVARQILPRGYSDVYQKEYRRKDGSLFPVELRTYLIRDDNTGAPAGMWAFVRDITERKRFEAALQQANSELDRKVIERTARLRELTLELTRTEQRERRRIAHILHEDLQQLLVAAKFRMNDLQERAVDATQRQTVDAGLAVLDQAIQVSRSLTVELRPPVLYELGLRAALDWLVQDMQQSLGLTVDCELSDTPEPASDDVRIFIFEAVRGLLLNVAKHSGVKRANIAIVSDKERGLRIVVEDKGKGVSEATAATPSFGLFSLRERAEALGGRFELESRPDRGTRATLILPGVECTA